ncbi:MAG: DUF6544 family protein [Pseudomonadota bacterium]
MNTIAVLIVTVVLILPIWLYARRGMDRRSDRREAERLLVTQTDAPLLYTRSMVKDLPEPARRYFNFAIEEGTPLYTVAKISMHGRICLENVWWSRRDEDFWFGQPALDTVLVCRDTAGGAPVERMTTPYPVSGVMCRRPFSGHLQPCFLQKMWFGSLSTKTQRA